MSGLALSVTTARHPVAPSSLSRQPDTRFDSSRDVLYVTFDEAQGAVQPILDDEEIFVFRDEQDARVIGLAIPHYEKYWRKHLPELAAHLSAYVSDRHLLASAIIIYSSTPRPHIVAP